MSQTHRQTIVETIAAALLRRAEAIIVSRKPDVVIGHPSDAYMLRWWVIPRNRLFNVYLHRFLRSDDDRALHDHPWVNASVLLAGSYTEHTIAKGGIHRRVIRKAGDMVARGPRSAHRIELHDGPCTTLFITGPKVRTWGFHCPEQGFIPWQRFTAAENPGEVGQGCEG